MRTWTRLATAFTLALAIILSPAAISAPQVPGIEGHITDAGKHLSPKDKEKIDQALGALQQESKLDFAMIILNEPVESLDELGQATFTTWNIGKEWEGGILLMISRDLKDCRIIMNSEHPIFEGRVGEQIQAQMLSNLQGGHLAAGLRSALEKVRRIIQIQRPRAEIPPPFEPNREGGRRYAVATLAVLLLAVASSRLRK